MPGRARRISVPSAALAAIEAEPELLKESSSERLNGERRNSKTMMSANQIESTKSSPG